MFADSGLRAVRGYLHRLLVGGYLVGVAEEACHADFEDVGNRN